MRKGASKPEMYALSTLLFVTVLVLLILVNVSPKEDAETAAARKHVRRRSRAGRILVKRVIPVAICLVFVGGGIYYASKGQMLTKEKLIVYNWGEYMDPDVITLFEEETGMMLYMKNLRQTRLCIRRSVPVPLPMILYVLHIYDPENEGE